MKLLALYKKYQNSGINGNPIISDDELLILVEKLKEMQEFLGEVNLPMLGIGSHVYSVNSTIQARDIKSQCNFCHISHKNQIKEFPIGTIVYSICGIIGFIQIPIGSPGTVEGHCDDGRACFKFKYDNSTHSFHYPEDWVSKQKPC